MANFLRTVLVQNEAQAADATIQRDLPVNPLSHIVITIRALTVAADVATTLASIYAMLPAVSISFRGQDIIRGSLQDLAVLNALLTMSPPWGQRVQDGANEQLSLSVPIAFGRRQYLVNEAFPAVRRGDLVLELQTDVAIANLNSLVLQVETVELLDETPERYLKYTTSNVTFTGTGEEDVRLPIGNPLLGVLLFGTTVPTAAATTATWERIRLLVDNVEALYARANWDSIHGEMARRLMHPVDFLSEHAHRYDGAAAAFDNTLQQQRANPLIENYAYLDFDPLLDGSYMLETAGRADVEIQRQAGTADAGRFVPVELVTVGGAGGV